MMEPMNSPAFRPNKLRYLVLPDEVKGQETKVEGSIYTIDKPKDPHEKPSEGTVVAKGNNCTEFSPGAKVLYGKYSGYEQLFDGVNYLILAETEILGERIVTPFDDGSFTPVTLRDRQTVREATEKKYEKRLKSISVKPKLGIAHTA